LDADSHLRDGAARAGLQSHPCHEHHGHSATRGRDEGLARPDTRLPHRHQIVTLRHFRQSVFTQPRSLADMTPSTPMSAIPPKADVPWLNLEVRYAPIPLKKSGDDPLRRVSAAALGSAWPVSEGSGLLRRGGTHRELRSVLVAGADPG
jgi:hypothetical protein